MNNKELIEQASKIADEMERTAKILGENNFEKAIVDGNMEIAICLKQCITAIKLLSDEILFCSKTDC